MRYIRSFVYASFCVTRQHTNMPHHKAFEIFMTLKAINLINYEDYCENTKKIHHLMCITREKVK